MVLGPIPPLPRGRGLRPNRKNRKSPDASRVRRFCRQVRMVRYGQPCMSLRPLRWPQPLNVSGAGVSIDATAKFEPPTRAAKINQQSLRSVSKPIQLVVQARFDRLDLEAMFGLPRPYRSATRLDRVKNGTPRRCSPACGGHVSLSPAFGWARGGHKWYGSRAVPADAGQCRPALLVAGEIA